MMEYYLFYAGGALILITLVLIFPTSRKRERELFSLLKVMEDGLLELKREIRRLKDELKEKKDSIGGFKRYLHQEMASSMGRGQESGYGEIALKYYKIKRLLEEGYDEERIAQELKIGHRELKLILKMKGWGT